MNIEINFGQACYPIQSILIYLIMYVYHSLHVIGTWKFVPLEKNQKRTFSHFLAIAAISYESSFQYNENKRFSLGRKFTKFTFCRPMLVNNKTYESNIDIFLHINITIHKQKYINIYINIYI